MISCEDSGHGSKTVGTTIKNQLAKPHTKLSGNQVSHWCEELNCSSPRTLKRQSAPLVPLRHHTGTPYPTRKAPHNARVRSIGIVYQECRPCILHARFSASPRLQQVRRAVESDRHRHGSLAPNSRSSPKAEAEFTQRKLKRSLLGGKLGMIEGE